MAQLGSGTPDQRSQAADTLSCFGDASRDAVPLMIGRFADSADARIRNNASRALGQIGAPAGAALPRLRQLAAEGNPAYSSLAERAIQRIEADISKVR